MATLTTSDRVRADGDDGGSFPDPFEKIVAEAITFDDVLLLPRRSDFTPADADVRTRLTRNIELNVPLLSAPMDTVTESALAIALAQEGGLGIIHKNLSPEAQAREVAKVKRSENGVIVDPVTLPPDAVIGQARQLMRDYNVSGVPIVGDGGRVRGILTRRDLKWQEDDGRRVEQVMTRDGLVTAEPGTTLEEAERILHKAKVEKLLLVDGEGRLAGLITMRDLDKLHQYPAACKDGRGRLRVGAAVGVGQVDRVALLVEAGVDLVCVDTAHGHSENVLRTVRAVKDQFDIDVIAGNVATTEGAADLIGAGADAVKVGIGPGSICTTRVVTGVGVPQVTAVMNAVRAAGPANVPVVADGGIRMSGDITKAIAAGASACMLGSLFAGLERVAGRDDHPRRPPLQNVPRHGQPWARWSAAAPTATARRTSSRAAASSSPRASRAASPTAARWATSSTNSSAAFGPAWATAARGRPTSCGDTPASAASAPPA